MNTSESDIAAGLSEATLTSTACAPVRQALAGDVDAAYRVQELVVGRRESRGSKRIGRKIGLTSLAVQKQLGVDQPDFGVLLDDMDDSQTGDVDVSLLIAPRIEAEVAFILSRDIDDAGRQNVIDSVLAVAAALEIVDSRIRDWDIGITDTVADNASSARFVISPDRLSLSEVDTRAVTMTLTRNGEPVSAGTGADCLGDPINALQWVAAEAIRLGRPLKAGEVVLSGALGPMVAFTAGDIIEANIQGLGTVRAHGRSTSTERTESACL